MGRRILIVGGGYAGMLAAVRLAKRTRGRGVAIALVDPKAHFVERIRLHEDAAGAVRPRRSLASMLEGTGVAPIAGSVRGVDLAARRAEIVPAGSGAVLREAFDDLVLATGSRAARVPSRALSCATEEDMLALRAKLATLAAGARVVVVGGGLTGVELAAELAERRAGLRVTLVSDGDVLPDATPAGRESVRRTLASLGVDVVANERVVAVDDGEVVLSSGVGLCTDATVWAAGFEASPLPAAIGLAVDELGRARVDARLRTVGHDFVRAIGDAARVEAARRPLRMACASAMPMAAFAADDLAREIRGEAPRPFAFSWFVRCVSLGRRAGLVERLDGEDRPSSVWLDGRPGAWFKESICRFTVASIALEKTGIGYSWPRGRSVVAAPSRIELEEAS